MTTKKRYVVRIVQTHKENGDDVNEGGIVDHSFLESLRYAGLITIHPVDGLTSICFDLLPPEKHPNTKDWADRNSERMRTFGFNAQAAPEANHIL